VKPTMTQQDAIDRKLLRQRLSSHLATLASCCQPDHAKATAWPSGELLQSIEDRVKLLTEGQKPPLWSTFRRLNRRNPELLLVSHVNNLVKRARERLAETGESELDKIARKDGGYAQELLRDIEGI